MTNRYWRSLRQARLSRRQVLAAAGTGATAAGVLAATSKGRLLRTSTAVAASAKGHGGRYQIGSPAIIDTLDPHTSLVGGPPYFPRIYNTLVSQSQVDPSALFFDLASSFEQPDENTWIFNIRPGVKVAPNNLGVPQREMDATDAFRSFERIGETDSALGSAFVRDWFQSHEASADGRTYTIGTPQPYAWFLYRIGSPFTTIPPRELLQGDLTRMRTAGVGGGPFTANYVPGNRLTLNKNQNYYRTDPSNNNAQLPYIDGMDVRFIADLASLRTAFLSRLTYEYITSSEAEANGLLSNSSVYSGAEEPVFTFISVTMNVKRPPFDDPASARR